MELGKIKQKVFLSIGWLSVILGLISLAILNIFLLWGYNTMFANNIFFWTLITLIFGTISAINKKSRSLGLWGLGLGVFLGLFVVVMFVLGWTVSPFP